MSWDDVLREVKQRRAKGQKASLLNDEADATGYNVKQQVHTTVARILKAYSLGAKYGETYFTRREAECMVWLLKGKTITGVAALLSLSPRTVEYYLKNMKAKLCCRTKFELIDLVHASDFLKNIDF